MTKIYINISLPNAIRSGATEHGPASLEIESWDGWSDEEREVLAGLIEGTVANNTISLPVASVDALHDRVRHEVYEIDRVRRIRAAQEDETRALVTEKGIGVLLNVSNQSVRCSVCSSWAVVEKQVWSIANKIIPDDLAKLARDERDKRNTDSQKAAAKRLADHEKRCLALAEEKRRAGAEKEEEWNDIVSIALSDEQKDRNYAGFLSEREINNAVRDHVFASLDNAEYERYKLIEHDDIAHCNDCDNENQFNYWVEDTEHLSRNQFAKMKKLENDISLLGHNVSVSAKPVTHKAECEYCEIETIRYGILLTVILPKGNKITREYEM
jgi:hypothetical protein